MFSHKQTNEIDPSRNEIKAHYWEVANPRFTFIVIRWDRINEAAIIKEVSDDNFVQIVSIEILLFENLKAINRK